MITEKNLAVLLLTFCLSAILFIALPTRSQTSSYDPWADVSGPTAGEPDGTINMRDIQYEILRFNTFGTPVNRTELLEAQSQIENLTTLIYELQSRLDSLNLTVIEQQNTINNLNNTVFLLNQTVIQLNGTQGLAHPDYDSGWIASPPGTYTFTHNLDTNASELLVYVLGRYTLYQYTHQWFYGSDHYFINGVERAYGMMWDSSDNNTIRINTYQGEVTGYYDFVRVKIWKIR